MDGGHDVADDVARAMATDILDSGRCPPGAGLTFTGTGALPSAFPVTEFAAASVGAAGVAAADLASAGDGRRRDVRVDRRLASMWFAWSLRPTGWRPPSPWDDVAGDYRTSDGWIRLHTNAAAHRAAALRVLGVPGGRDRAQRAVAEWDGVELESRVVGAGGCAAVMRSTSEWASGEQGRSVACEPLIAWEDGDRSETGPVLAGGARPLEGVRVLDLTRVLAGPVATRFLALLGADVLRVDPPWWDEPGLVPEVMLGKRSARLDLRGAGPRGRLLELLGRCDVLVHGYRPGALDRLGLGADVRHGVRPGLVEVGLDAYGWTGPWRTRRGFDSLVQMSTGIADAAMREGGLDAPKPLPVQALDHGTGYLMAYAALEGLRRRVDTGQGSLARLSLARTALLLAGRRGTGDPGPLDPEGDGDLAPGVEDTSWGPARRLRMPLEVEGVVLAAPRPAGALGASKARW
ncbi:CoA transferase [Nocardiopsis tropica]|uniref:CoA transferase n=1 Tax=Nocardiopsis tropica TaxID=109330 RepID=UPI0031E143F0